MAGALANVYAACNASGLVNIGSSTPATVDLAADATLSQHFKHISDELKTIILNAITIKITDAGAISAEKHIKLARDLYKLIHADVSGNTTPQDLTALTPLSSAFTILPKQKIWEPYTYSAGTFQNAGVNITNLTDLFENIRYGLKLTYTDTNSNVIVKYKDFTNPSMPVWEKSASQTTRNAINVSGFSPATVSITEPATGYFYTRGCFSMTLGNSLLTTFGVTAADIAVSTPVTLEVIAYIGTISAYGAPLSHSVLTGANGQPLAFSYKRSGEIVLTFAVANQDTTSNPESYQESDFGWLGEYQAGVNDTSLNINVTGP